MAKFSASLYQKSLYEFLNNNSALKAKITGIFDHVDEGRKLPYITLGGISIRDWSAKTFSAEEHLTDLHIWSAHRGSEEVRDIADQTYETLENPDLNLGSNHHLVNLKFIFFESFYDEKNEINHGIIRFSAKIMAI